MSIVNLDQKAAVYAQKIIQNIKVESADKKKDPVNVITKALGVLQEQGVYALMLFLLKEKADPVRLPLQQLLLEIKDYLKLSPGVHFPDKNTDKNTHKNDDILKFYGDYIIKDIDTLFMVRDLYEQTLIYARYSAKAQGKEKPEKTGAGSSGAADTAGKS